MCNIYLSNGSSLSPKNEENLSLRDKIIGIVIVYTCCEAWVLAHVAMLWVVIDCYKRYW